MSSYPPAFLRLIDELAGLPGIGRKTAGRLAFHLLKQPAEACRSLAGALQDLHTSVRTCSRCFNLSEGELCALCTDGRRSQAQLCVVEEPKDLGAIERTGDYRGLYHVLGGALSPLEGLGPEALRIKELLERLKDGSVEEVILATNHDVEGEATALYLARLIKPLGLRLTRLATGLPMGLELEYADQMTLSRALQGRREM